MAVASPGPSRRGTRGPAELAHFPADESEVFPALLGVSESDELEAQGDAGLVGLFVAELGVGVDGGFPRAEDDPHADGLACDEFGDFSGNGRLESPCGEVGDLPGPDGAVIAGAFGFGIASAGPETDPDDFSGGDGDAGEAASLEALHVHRPAERQRGDACAVGEFELALPGDASLAEVLVVLELEAQGDLFGRDELVGRAVVGRGHLDENVLVGNGEKAAMHPQPGVALNGKPQGDLLGDGIVYRFVDLLCRKFLHGVSPASGMARPGCCGRTNSNVQYLLRPDKWGSSVSMGYLIKIGRFFCLPPGFVPASRIAEGAYQT
jgi:hypothetical protein